MSSLWDRVRASLSIPVPPAEQHEFGDPEIDQAVGAARRSSREVRRSRRRRSLRGSGRAVWGDPWVKCWFMSYESCTASSTARPRSGNRTLDSAMHHRKTGEGANPATDQSPRRISIGVDDDRYVGADLDWTARLPSALGDRRRTRSGSAPREGDTVGVAGGYLITRDPVAATSTGTFAILEPSAAIQRIRLVSGPLAIPRLPDAAATPDPSPSASNGTSSPLR